MKKRGKAKRSTARKKAASSRRKSPKASKRRSKKASHSRKPSRSSRKSFRKRAAVKKAVRKKASGKKAAGRGAVRKNAAGKKAAGKRKAPRSVSYRRTKKVKPSNSLVAEPMEQVIVTCANCGRQFSIVKLPGLSTEGMICQRCEVGEIEFPE